MGGPLGAYLIVQRNFFVEQGIPRSLRRKKLTDAEMDAYRGPFPTPESRRPVLEFPREILASRAWLAETETRLPTLRDRPALLVWPTKDPVFGTSERQRWEQVFPNHRTIGLEGAGHYIQEDAADEIVSSIRAWAADTR